MRFKSFYKYLFVLLVLLFGMIGCGGGGSSESKPPSTPIPISTPIPTQTPAIVKNSVITSRVSGNTASYNAIATFYVRLDKKPSADVVIPLSSSDTDEGVVDVNELRFTPNNWNRQQRVLVKGRNSDVVDGKQDYKIILGTIESSDNSYNGVNPDDVSMKGIYLKLNKITDSTKFISGLKSTIAMNTEYTGNDILVYSLEKKPDGMTIDKSSGLISWKPLTSNEGKSYDVKVKLTDGILSAISNFKINVPLSVYLDIKKEGNIVSVVDQNSKLKGLSIENMDTNNGNMKIKTISENDAPIINDIVKLSDVFIVENMSRTSKIKLPPIELLDKTSVYQITLFNYKKMGFHSDKKGWLPIRTGFKVEKIGDDIEITLNGYNLSGVFFIGILNVNPKLSTNESIKKVMMSKDNSFSCSPQSEILYNPIVTQNCTLANSKFTIQFINFTNETLWNSTSKTDILKWVEEVQLKLDTLGLTYEEDDTLNIIISTYANDFGGAMYDGSKQIFLTPDIMYNKKTIKETMKDAFIHEFFHYSHHLTLIENSLNNEDKEKKIHEFLENNDTRWITESMARWFQDYFDDNSNTDVSYMALNHGNTVLDRGITSPTYRYEYFALFKLLESKCHSFKKDVDGHINIIDIFNGIIDGSNGANTLKDIVESSSCDFGNQLGENKKSSFESALLFYQYATVGESNITLLDSNEDKSKFSFHTTPYKYKQSDWFRFKEIEEVNKNIKIKDILNIPAYGAYSIQIEGEKDLKDNLRQVLRVTTVEGSKPLTISIIAKESGFEGIPTHQINGKEHIHYTTDEKSEHIFKETKLTSYFITILNPNDTIVTIDELVFEVREEDTKLKADAGKDKVIWEGEEVVLDASGSKGNNLSYEWYRQNYHSKPYLGEFYVFDDLKNGVHTFILEVTGNQGSLDSDEVRVTVKEKLVADAGINQTIPMGNEIKLDGSKSKGAISWKWSQGVILLGTGENITIPKLSEGEHEILLTVKNNFGDEMTDKVWITVTKALQLYLEANIEGESKKI